MLLKRGTGVEEQAREREIEKMGAKQRIENEVIVPIFHFPVSRSVESVDTVKTKPRCSPTIYGP